MALQFLRDEKLPADVATRVGEWLRNVDWFNEHSAEISARGKGKYVAVVDGKFFAADSRKEAYDLARAHHPATQPFVIYIPLKARKMIYRKDRILLVAEPDGYRVSRAS